MVHRSHSVLHLLFFLSRTLSRMLGYRHLLYSGCKLLFFIFVGFVVIMKAHMRWYPNKYKLLFKFSEYFVYSILNILQNFDLWDTLLKRWYGCFIFYELFVFKSTKNSEARYLLSKIRIKWRSSWHFFIINHITLITLITFNQDSISLKLCAYIGSYVLTILKLMIWEACDK